MKCVSENIFCFFKKVFYGNYRLSESSPHQISPHLHACPPPPIEAQLFDLKLKQRVDLDGCSIFVMPEDYVGWSILTARAYESHVTKVARAILHPGDVFLDVGANLGFFSL
jgi:hypothetical protein